MRHPVPLPETWEVATIDEVTSYVQRGKSPTYTDKSDLPVVNQKCIRWSGVDPQWLKFVHPDQWPQWGEERFLQPGDVLWNSTGTGTIGRAALFRGLSGYERAVVDSHVTILRTGVYSPALLHYWIMSPAVQAKIDRMQAGSTNQVELSRAEVLGTQVVVPPLPEQQRIVAAIESYLTRLDNAVALLQRVEENLKRYRASVLKAAVEGRLVPTEATLARQEGRGYEPASELLKRILAERKTRRIEDATEKARAKAEEKARKAGQSWTAEDNAATLGKERAKAAKQYKEPAAPDLSAHRARAGTTDLPELPEGWCWVTVDQLAGDVTYGSSARTGADPGRGVPVLRMGNIADGRVDFADLKYLDREHEELPTLLLQPGDLLFNRTNSAELVGKSAVYKGEVMPCSFASYLIRVRLVAGGHSGYVCSFLNSFWGRKWIASVVSQQVGQANVNGTKLRACCLPLPPKAEQERIMSEAERGLAIAETTMGDVGRIALRCVRLRQSILTWAFEGKLVEQDPSDEPAAALLERISAERAAAANEARR